MEQVRMYTTGVCPYCNMAKKLLKDKGVKQIEEIRIDVLPNAKDEMINITGRKTVPQIFIGDLHVGGFDDLNSLNKQGILSEILG